MASSRDRVRHLPADPDQVATMYGELGNKLVIGILYGCVYQRLTDFF